MGASAQAPSLPLPAPQRPIGLVLAAIAMGLMAGMGLLSGLMMVLTFLFIHTPETAQYPAIKVIEIVISALPLLISGFCLWTVVGLFRIRRWARISILVFGGCITFFALIAALSSVAVAFSPSMVMQSSPGLSPGGMKAVLLGSAGFYLCAAFIGIWWLVYFNLRRVRTLFAAYGVRSQEVVAAVPAGEVWVAPDKPKHSVSVIGVLVNCLAACYFFGAVTPVVLVPLHLPLLFLGYVLRGALAAVVLFLISAVAVGIGVGLIRRMKAAWIAALVFNALGLISELMLFTPGNRIILHSYQLEIFERISHVFPIQANRPIPGPMDAIGLIIGPLVTIVIFWLLIRGRSLFLQK